MDAATTFPLRDRLEAVFARGGDVRAIAQPAGIRADDPRELRDATYLSSHGQPVSPTSPASTGGRVR
jgi:hypothetical protein